MASLADELAAADSNARRAGDWHDPEDSSRRLVHEEVIPVLENHDFLKKTVMQAMKSGKEQRALSAKHQKQIAERRKQDAIEAEKSATRWKKVDRLVKNTAQEKENKLKHELKLAKDELAELREQAAQPDTGPSKARLNMRLDHCHGRVQWLEERNAKLTEEIDDILDERLSSVRWLEERNANLKDEIDTEYVDANDREAQLHGHRRAVKNLEARNSVLKKQAGRYKRALAAYDDPCVPDEAKQFLAGY